MIPNSEQEWGAIAKALHWIMALGILAMFILGWVAVTAPVSPTKLELFIWHKSMGLSLLGLVCVRLLWRLTNKTPIPPSNVSPLEHRLAKAGHAMLYLLMILMPLSGYVINSTANFTFKFFGWMPVPNLIPASKAWQTIAENVHFTLFWVFALLIAVHIAAAIRHHVIKRNNVLSRMLPTRTPPSS